MTAVMAVPTIDPAALVPVYGLSEATLAVTVSARGGLLEGRRVDAVRLAKSTASAKYDETVEVALRLGVDPRKADQIVRGTVALPSGTGKDVRVAVFAVGEQATAARA